MPRPIRTTESNFTFRGPVPNIADFPGRIERAEPAFYGIYKFTDEERQMIANGANVELGVHTIPIPPVSLNVTAAEEQWSDDDLLCTGCNAVWLATRDDVGETCNWCGNALYRPTEQRHDHEPAEKPEEQQGPPGPQDPPRSPNHNPVG